MIPCVHRFFLYTVPNSSLCRIEPKRGQGDHGDQGDSGRSVPSWTPSLTSNVSFVALSTPNRGHRGQVTGMSGALPGWHAHKGLPHAVSNPILWRWLYLLGGIWSQMYHAYEWRTVLVPSLGWDTHTVVSWKARMVLRASRTIYPVTYNLDDLRAWPKPLDSWVV